MTNYHYTIERGTSPVTGTPNWAVVQWADDGAQRQAAGADAHWVRQRFAHRAKRLYKQHPELHGRPESQLRIAHGLFIESDETYAETERWVLARLGAIASGVIPTLSAAESDRLAESAPDDEPQEWAEHWRIARHDLEDDIECWICDEVSDIAQRRAYYWVTSGPPPAVTDGTRNFYELAKQSRAVYDPHADEWSELVSDPPDRERTWSRLAPPASKEL